VTPIAELIESLRRAGVRIALDGDSITARGQVAGHADALAELKARKSEALALLREMPAAKVLPPLGRRERVEKAPLSDSQKVWFPLRAQWAQHLRVPIHQRVSGPLDPKLLERALQALVQRHEILRTRYGSDGTSCWQNACVTVPTRLDVIDVSPFPFVEREARMMALMREVWRGDETPFHTGVNLRARLVRVAPQDHVLFIWLNHIAADGPSVSLLLRDLFEFYAAMETGGALRLPALRIQYVDYAQWEQSLERTTIGDAAAWTRFFGDAKAIDLRQGKVFEPEPSTPAAALRVLVPYDVWGAATQLARRLASTPALLATCALGALLAHWTKQRRFVFGNVSTVRPPGAENLIGCFMRVKPVLLEYQDNDDLAAALSMARRSVARSMDRRVAFADRFVEAAGVTRVTVNTQMRRFENANLETSNGLLVRPFAAPLLDRERIGGDLAIELEERGPILTGSVAYAVDRIDPLRAQWFAEGFVALIRRLTESPTTPLDVLIETLPPVGARPLLGQHD
jgi:hypothetical protein